MMNVRVSPFQDRRQKRAEREKQLDKIVKESMRVGLVVGDDGRLLRFVR